MDTDIYDQLIENMQKYHPAEDFSMIEKAYRLAKSAHENQLRKSGEPYIIHPLEVAVILSELELDRETIVAGILHDVIEDTAYSYDDVSRLFSEEIAQLVDGVTKLEKIQYSSREEERAENYRKMFLAMSNDIRVILIKIADRLHNLRTLKYMSPEKQKEKAQETLDIYAPLAHRLGISKVRYELEDLSFRYLEPEAYKDLKEKIQKKQSERNDYVQGIVAEFSEKISEAGIDADVEGRPKHFFSIYKKMVGQNKTLDQIYDLFAVRAIVNTVQDCYGVLGIAHVLYKPIQGRFKDYIAMPKPNMYQSIHNTLIGPGGEPFEIQIRTWDMHRTAEYGIAAHWKYKEGKTGAKDGKTTPENEADKGKEKEKLAWLKQILEWQRETEDNGEFLAVIKGDFNVYKDHVYCFSPKGDVYPLLSGATPVDFAYAVHSAVGNKMIGARVNNKIVPIDYVLQTGDRVEIMTSQNSKGPSKDWLKIAKTSGARTKISQWFKKENKDEHIIRGKDSLEKAAKKKGVTLSELLNPEALKAVFDRFSMHDWDSVCAAVGHGSLRDMQVINRLYEDYLRKNEKELSDKDIMDKLSKPKIVVELSNTKKSSSGIEIVGVGDSNVRFSKCCSPVPGDEIVGYITRGRGVSIHRTDCVNILHMDATERERLIDAEWHTPDKPGGEALFRADIGIVAVNRMGLLVDISKVFSEEKIDVESLNARTSNNKVIFNVAISISSKTQLEDIFRKLYQLPEIETVERVTT